jgi:cation transport regulator ChaC
MSDGHWIFGYGSLVWRPDFPFAESRQAVIEGWARRFWQGSTDHRGVPGAPGRVVTLVAEPGAHCAGTAYRVDDAVIEGVIETLEHREKGGYRREEIEIVLTDGVASRVGGMFYIATPGNPNYLGPAPLPAIASQVRKSVGPSGHNVEYVTRLAEALRRMNADDPHVFDLERLVIGDCKPRAPQ